MNIHLDLRVDVQNTFFHNVYLVFANCTSGRNDLSVEICQTYFVIIDQVNCSDSASYKCLDSITANSADSKYGNMGAGQFLHRLFAK